MCWEAEMAKSVVFAAWSGFISETVQLQRDEAWDATDPVVTAHPEWFTSYPAVVRTSIPPGPYDALPWGERPETTVTAAVEAAVADPGTRRTVTSKGTEVPKE
jgi:hypothetical protein